MAKRKAVKTSILDWCQGVLEETKDLVDDSIDRFRDDDDDDDLVQDVRGLKEVVAALNTRLDVLAAPTPVASKPGVAKAPARS